MATPNGLQSAKHASYYNYKQDISQLSLYFTAGHVMHATCSIIIHNCAECIYNTWHCKQNRTPQKCPLSTRHAASL